MANSPSGGGSDPLTHQLAVILAIIAIFGCWPLVRLQIPADSRFNMADLVAEHWAHRNTLQPWLDRRWTWLALENYHLWFALAALPGVFAVALVQAIDRRSLWPLLHAFAGWGGGGLIGIMLFDSFRGDSPALAVMMPAVFAFLGGAIGARLGAMSGVSRHLRGTKLRSTWPAPLGKSWARHRGRVALAGVPLSRADETMHLATIGATGSGKSTALRGLMRDALARGDRQVVADPESASLNAFGAAGDIILNPFDARCARWDLLAEIERPSDFAFLSTSLLPHLGQGDHDQWISYAQQLLAGTLENFWTLRLGTSDDFIEMLGCAKLGELRQLCVGTPAARYFEEGGERMLASIMGTMAPAIGNLRHMAARQGEPFSLRAWVRGGSGSLWMPYAANEVAALRGLISCWMNIAIFETLSLPPSSERRIWFQIDEMDALGRIEGLTNALARLRKFGGCVALGFQSYAQLQQVYGDGAETIIENCGNLLLLRSGLSDEGGTAKLVSQLIGSREVERQDINRTRSRGRYLTRSMSMQTRRAVEDVVLPSEIMQLPDREGFVKRAGAPDWLRVKFPYEDFSS